MKKVEDIKYKETTPAETVSRIRDILKGIGVAVHEVKWFIDSPDYYSLRLEICESGHETLMNGVGTNGKGTSAEFALASAYAEFMERLQNQALFLQTLGDEEIKYGGFARTPDEIQVSADEILNEPERFLLPVMSREALEKYLSSAATIFSKDRPSGFTAIPYYHVNSGAISHLPTALFQNCFTTTGMSAGNSPEEALVQGISEIYERYAMLRIETGNITPPDIDREYVNTHMPRISKMADMLEGSGFNVILKDCSLGEGLPAYAAVIIHRDTQRYWVNFGAHPIMEIGLERCLTEFLQGVPAAERRTETRLEFSFFEKFDTNNMYNHAENLESCTGYYPNHLFSLDPSYPFDSSRPPVHGKSNQEMLAEMLEYLMNRKMEVFIRNNSFLGFPAYSVIIPGMSQTHLDDADMVFPHLVNNDAGYARGFSIVKKIRSASAEDIDFLLEFMDGRPESFKINELFGGMFPREDFFHVYSQPRQLMESLCLFSLGEYRDGYFAMDDYVDYLRENKDYGRDSHVTAYYRCARDYMGILADDQEKGVKKDARRILEMFFNRNVVERVLSDLKDPGAVFENFPEFDCHDCENCDHRNGCFYRDIAGHIRTLKDCYLKNTPDQNLVGRLCLGKSVSPN